MKLQYYNNIWANSADTLLSREKLLNTDAFLFNKAFLSYSSLLLTI